MEDGRWEFGDGRWECGDGRWEFGNGRSEMADGRCRPRSAAPRSSPEPLLSHAIKFAGLLALAHVVIDIVERHGTVHVFRLRLHACVSMTNHYHLLVEAPDGNVSPAMQR